MVANIIIGSNYGDEGKGTVTATCVKHSTGNTLNVLTNGGAQRAHSILTETGNFTFQHFGSGTYHGASSYFSKYFIINPMQFAKEYNELEIKGIIPCAYRDSRCRWSTPFDMIANAIIEKLRKDNKHGSCGMGIWETVLRYKNTEYNKSFDEFMQMDESSKINYLQLIKNYFEINRISDGIPHEWEFIWNNVNIIMHFISDCEFMYENTIVCPLKEVIQNKIFKFNNIIFENGQGLLLSDTGKDIAGTTPSLTGCDYAKELIRETNIPMYINIHYVTRSYLTRHGKGMLSNEMDKVSISSNIQEDRTNHYNIYQESFRYGCMTDEFIIKMHDYIIKDAEKINNANIILDITHCDEIDNISKFKKIFKNVITYDSPIIK
ncbi:MAG: adenylosuccinate synthetase [Wendovervirus sonii]|uniref:Adenylosuccinate synthetase n=1 Tax=phage Lak_Megaphage_Sonny TaxID=3109229 RepID=A0ABZ0Z596_9CAUD|nr:MAG: adenylosuccinate synthetase [phage Lak_Megaphage_Sonny]